MTLANIAPLTESEVNQLAADWYLKLDVHALSVFSLMKYTP